MYGHVNLDPWVSPARAICNAVATGDPAQLTLWLALLAADFAVLSFSYRFGSRLGLIGMESVEHGLRMLATDRLLSPGPAAPEVARRPGAALSLATADAARVAEAVTIGIFPVGQLANISNSGTLFAFAAVSIAVMVIRRTDPGRHRPFRTPNWSGA